MIWFDRVEDIMHLKAKPLQIRENFRCVKSDIWKIGDQSYGSLKPGKISFRLIVAEKAIRIQIYIFQIPSRAPR